MEKKDMEYMKLANQLCFPLYAASRSVISLYTPALKELGLTYTQYILMLVLWETDGITVGEICERLMLDNGTVSGRELQDKASRVPETVARCIDLPAEKAVQLYELLYELMENNKKRNK